MKSRLVTSNLAELCYLLEQNHHLIDASLCLGDLGAEIMLFTVEGKNVELDRKLFLGTCRTSLKKVPDALKTICEVLWKKGEEETGDLSVKRGSL